VVRDVDLAARCDRRFDQRRTSPGQMSLQSPRGIFFLAKTNVVTRMLIAGVEMQEIDSHLLSRNPLDTL
jgi:hypothetical protein